MTKQFANEYDAIAEARNIANRWGVGYAVCWPPDGIWTAETRKPLLRNRDFEVWEVIEDELPRRT